MVSGLSIPQVELLGLDEFDDFVVLFKLDYPLTEAFCSVGGLLYALGTELGVFQELSIDLLHGCWSDVAFVVVLELGHEVSLTHELLRGEPPVVFELLWIVFFGCSFNFSVTHDAHGMQNHLHILGWMLQDPDLVDMGSLDGMEGIICCLQDGPGLGELVLAHNLALLSLHSDRVCLLFLLLDQSLPRLDLILSCLLELSRFVLCAHFHLLKLWLLFVYDLLHLGDLLLLLL